MSRPDPTIIVLPAIADLDALERLRDELVEAGDAGIRIEAADVERVSTNTLLLLLAAGKAAQSARVPFHIGSASPIFRLSVSRLGLDAHFAALLEG